MTTKEDKKIKKAVALAKKKQSEFFDDESEIELKAFREAMKKEFGVDEEVIKKPSKRIQLKKPIIVCSDSDEEESQITNQEPIINCSVDIPEAIVDETPTSEIKGLKPSIIPVFELASHRLELASPSPAVKTVKVEPVIKSILQESREEIPKTEQKLISVKKAPYDLKPSNEKLRIEELNKTIYDMKQKYDNLMNKYNARGEEVKQLKKENEEQKITINKLKPKTDIEKLNIFINENYQITTNRNDKIKCSEIYNKFYEINKSFNPQGFNKALAQLNINKCQKDGINHYYCIKVKEIEEPGEIEKD
jgi:hypothetical protein